MTPLRGWTRLRLTPTCLHMQAINWPEYPTMEVDAPLSTATNASIVILTTIRKYYEYYNWY
jgi:hypothetical protein